MVPPPSARPVIEEDLPTKMRGGPLKPAHWAIMVVAAIVPLAVWGLVAYVAINGPIGRVKAPAAAASGAASAK